ncbi:MAG: tail fiber domain-containing protein [Thermoanaerobaculia bacterium]
MRTRRNVIAIVALCSLFMTPWLEAREPTRPLAEMAIGASRIDWQPAVDTGRLVLTVAGPDGFWLRKEFKVDQPAFLSLSDRERFPDGAYTYELRQISGQVQSGHFSIKNGSFVMAPAKPPLRNVTANLTDDDLIIQGYGCIGEECTTSDDDFPVLRLKGQNPNLLFDDVEGPPSLLSSSFNDWAIRINASDVAKFSIVDFDGALTPFSILGGAPDNSLFINDNGDVGIGTATPAERLHVVEDADANTLLTVENPNTGTSALGGIRAKSDSAIVSFQAHGSGRTLSRFGQTLASWAEFLQVTGNGFILGTLADKPLILGTNSTNRVHIAGSGNVGIGTSSPSVPLHVSRSTGATLEGIRLTNDNEARITIENTTQSTKYIMAVNNTNPALFFISRDGGGGTIIEVNKRLDAGGVPSLNVNGSVAATNVVFSSSRDLKKDFKKLDQQALLAQVAKLPISEWSFKDGPEQVRHIGPMAEDFHAAFGLSQNQNTISVTDTTGVALAAIQALLQRVEDLEMRNADLTERLLALESPRLENPIQP